MRWVHSKRFWLGALHVGLIAGGTVAASMVPGLGVVVMAGTGLMNAALPSPFSK